MSDFFAVIGTFVFIMTILAFLFLPPAPNELLPAQERQYEAIQECMQTEGCVITSDDIEQLRRYERILARGD